MNISEIESKICSNEISIHEVFTLMNQHVNRLKGAIVSHAEAKLDGDFQTLTMDKKLWNVLN